MEINMLFLLLLTERKQIQVLLKQFLQMAGIFGNILMKTEQTKASMITDTSLGLYILIYFRSKLGAMPTSKPANQHKHWICGLSLSVRNRIIPILYILNKLCLYSFSSMYVLFVISSQLPTPVQNYPFVYMEKEKPPAIDIQMVRM